MKCLDCDNEKIYAKKVCIKCYYKLPIIKKQRKEYREKLENKERIQQYAKKYREKPENKKKQREYTKIYENSIEGKEIRKRCRKLPKNIKKEKKYNDVYYKKPEVKKRINLSRKIKRKNNSKYRISFSIRTRIWAGLKGNSKSKSTEEILGCTFKEFNKCLRTLLPSGR